MHKSLLHTIMVSFVISKNLDSCSAVLHSMIYRLCMHQGIANACSLSILLRTFTVVRNLNRMRSTGTVEVELTEDMVNACVPGDVVTIVGVVKVC